MVLLAIITSLFIAIQDPIVQKFVVRFASGYLSEKTGADIKVGQLVVTPDLRVYVGDVTVKDLKDNNLAKVKKLKTQFNIPDLLDGKIHLENVELQGTEANIIKYEGEDKFNFAFLVEAFKTDTVEKPDQEPFELTIDKISFRDVDFVYWNQNEDKPEKTEQHLMDYSHIGVTGVSFDATDFYMLGDSIYAKVGLLSGVERSGLDIKHFSSDVVVFPKGVYLDGLEMETNNSLFDADIHMMFNDFDDIGEFVDSVYFDATFRPSDVMLSDVGVFASVMYKMPNRIQFEGHLSGPVEHFRVDDMKASFGEATTIQGSVSMHPLDFENGEHSLNIKNMHFTYNDLVNFYIPSSTKTIPLPESLRPLDESAVSLVFRGSYNDFTSIINLHSNIGNIDANIARSTSGCGDDLFSGSINGEGVDVSTFLDNSTLLGQLDMNAGFSMKFPQKGSPELEVNGNLLHANLLGNQIDEITMDGAMKEDRFNGTLRVDDNDLVLDFNGLIDFQNTKNPQSNFDAVVHYADLHAFNVLDYDSISEISTQVKANMKGYKLDDLVGSLDIRNTVYRDSHGEYRMDSLVATIDKDNVAWQRVNINSDFFDFEMNGKVNYEHLLSTLNDIGDHYVHFPMWNQDRIDFRKYGEKHDVGQDFSFNLTLKDTRTLSRLFMPELQIAENSRVIGSVNSRAKDIELTVLSKKVRFGDVTINDVDMRNNTMYGALFNNLTIGSIAWTNITETDTLALGVDNFVAESRMAQDTISSTIKWDDKSLEDHNKAKIETYFTPHETGGIFGIKAADILLNDSLWTASSNNFIEWSDDRVSLSNLMFSHNQQSIRVDGYVPMGEADTLSVQLQKFDVSNFDFLLKGYDIDGYVSGNALVSNLTEKPMVLADLQVQKLAMDDIDIGDAVVESSWNNDDKSIDLNVNILNDWKQTLNAYGSYYTARDDDNLDFTLEMDSLQLAVVSPFLVGIASRVQGFGNGTMTVKGSLDDLDIQGKLKVKDGGCKIEYLNTYYTFSPTIRIDNSTIGFEKLVLTDTLGNTARVEGEIKHDHLKDFRLDLKMYLRDFLAMATSSKDNDSFYGTAVANGLVTITGPFDDISLDIKALTQKGTNITIPLNQVSTVSDNDFIVFISKETEENEEEMLVKKDEPESNLAIGLDVTATEDAKLNIILPEDLGTINATGSGNINLTTSSKDPLDMRGNYTIKSGSLKLSLVNLVQKQLSLRQGGTILWSGDPTDGRINVTGVYNVRTSLSGLGIQVDSTASNSNIEVECLIHLKGALLNPTFTFGMNLPNASEDITQTVYALVDTTNQAVMTQQAVSLLMLGQFAYAGGSGGSDLNLSNVFSGGVQLDINDNLNLGLKYHSGNDDSYNEYQVAMHTELFENRLTIETNLGVMSSNNPSAESTSNIVGEFDLYYKLSKDGHLMGHFYNHSNYNSNYNSFSFDRRSPYTQGLGLSYSKSFTTFRDLFKKKTVMGNTQPFIKPKNQEKD